MSKRVAREKAALGSGWTTDSLSLGDTEEFGFDDVARATTRLEQRSYIL